GLTSGSTDDNDLPARFSIGNDGAPPRPGLPAHRFENEDTLSEQDRQDAVTEPPHLCTLDPTSETPHRSDEVREVQPRRHRYILAEARWCFLRAMRWSWLACSRCVAEWTGVHP